MFGLGRFQNLADDRRARATLVGLIIASLIVGASATYTVRSGDTLSEIAKSHGTSVSALATANKLRDPDLIRVGQVLTLPGDSSQKTHKVRFGETLGEIVAKHGVSVAALVKANGLKNANVIRVGQVLDIPGSTGATPTAPPATTVTHTVRSGETLSEIAARYKTTVAAIVKLNNISNPALIVAGTKLVISGSGSAETKTHTVRSGETLGSIAIKYGTTASALAKLNKLTNPNSIRVGQKLEVPATGTSTPSSTFTCPVPGSRFVNDYGYIKPDGRFHQGIDLFAKRGTQVRAPVSGRVEAVNGTLGGLQFWLHGDDGNLYIGTHLSAFGLVGQVPAGAVIGAVGDSGNALGAPPHLHFEILVNGKATNPYPKLAQSCR